jgi:hypothetical protein
MDLARRTRYVAPVELTFSVAGINELQMIYSSYQSKLLYSSRARIRVKISGFIYY